VPVLRELHLSGAELEQATPRRGQEPALAQAGVEWHQGELHPRVGFIVTNLARPAERVVAFYNQRGTAEQWIKEGKGALKWTRLSCPTFAANAVRLQLHALAYNLGNFMRTLAMPKTAEPGSLTSLREKLIKIGAMVVSHGRYVIFQMAEVAVSRQMFADILSADRSAAGTACAGMTSASQVHRAMRGEVCLVEAKRRVSASGRRQPPASIALCSWRRRFAVAQAGQKRDPGLEMAGNLANVGLDVSARVP
jgi:Transposase DDE domain group 1